MSDILRVGDRSPRVAEVRTALTRLGLVPDSDKEIKQSKGQTFTDPETYFDEELAEVIKGMQQARGIIASGEINEVTLRALREASYKLGARVLSFEPNNIFVGDDVLQLQTQLQELGFYTDRVDGRFGDNTYKALLSYQINYGLKSDGICGPETIRAFGRLAAGSPAVLHRLFASASASAMLALCLPVSASSSTLLWAETRVDK